MPQPKKDPSVRARANRASTAATLTDGRSVIRPDLPERDWHPLTVEWWDDLWASPMAGEYHASDRHGLFILAALVDAFWRSPSKELAGEIRLQRQSFGLTPYDRRRLEWTIETAEDAKERGRARDSRPSAQQPSRATDPRLALVQ